MDIEIVPSPRIDYCSACDAEHGYDCPKDIPSPDTPQENHIGQSNKMVSPDAEIEALDGLKRGCLILMDTLPMEIQEVQKIGYEHYMLLTATHERRRREIPEKNYWMRMLCLLQTF